MRISVTWAWRGKPRQASVYPPLGKRTWTHQLFLDGQSFIQFEVGRHLWRRGKRTLPFSGLAQTAGLGGSAHHHGLPCRQVWQQPVFLHDVAGHFPERPQVPGFSIDQDLTLHSSLSGKTNKKNPLAGVI